MKKESQERRVSRAGDPKLERRVVISKDHEETITYRTITRTEFQRRRASFENRDEDKEKSLGVKTRSVDELARMTDEDTFRMKEREREMTEKLEDIHKMIRDMQQLTNQLKDRRIDWRAKATKEGYPGSCTAVTRDLTAKSQAVFLGSKMTLAPVRYKSTILITIGSKHRRFKEEIELRPMPKDRA